MTHRHLVVILPIRGKQSAMPDDVIAAHRSEPASIVKLGIIIIVGGRNFNDISVGIVLEIDIGRSAAIDEPV